MKMIRYGMLALMAVAASMNAPAQEEKREALMKGATAYWRFGDEFTHAKYPLTIFGDVTPTIVAEFKDGYLDAGKNIAITGNQITVYLRARDPDGKWAYALFSKRGSHETVTFNLFSVDLPGTTGPDIGFEIHTETGFVMVSFPVSSIDPKAWHDFAGRYDGKRIELICDGQVMAAHTWNGGALTQNQEPILIGGETDNGKVVRPYTGEMEEAALWTRALSDEELARIMKKEHIVSDASCPGLYVSPIHYRPDIGRLADTIPFFWKGQYHIFYLRAVAKVPWEHIVSTDLIHWKELPTALKPDGAPDGPDGLHMFTGSVIEHGGTFHIFYTGWNPENKEGREKIMHATSPDLVTWTKHPEDGFFADGIHYQNTDFRDPYVFWNAQDQFFWMICCARDAQSGQPVQGRLVSKDLVHWEQVSPLVFDPPLGDGTPECPDLFTIDDTYYLIDSPSAGTTDMRYAKEILGPYRSPESNSIDTPILYAAKRMFDGKRHIITGWIRDLNGEHDGGGFEWGGDQSVPREVWAGPEGQLLFKPVPEAAAAFTRTVRRVSNKDIADGVPCILDAPNNYYLDCQVSAGAGAELLIMMRRQSDGQAYTLSICPTKGQATIKGAKFDYPRKVRLDESKPVSVQAFVQGSIIECFINGSYAFSCRAYDLRLGRLIFDIVGGKGHIDRIEVKTP